MVKTAGTEYADLACRGLTFAPPDCATWLLWKEADGPINIFKASEGLFPLITGQEPPFKEALEWLKFEYTADYLGAYMAPASTLLAQSAVAEGGELFPELLAYPRRIYPEVYGPVVFLGRAPQRKEAHIGEGEVLSGKTSINSIKLGLRLFIPAKLILVNLPA